MCLYNVMLSCFTISLYLCLSNYITTSIKSSPALICIPGFQKFKTNYNKLKLSNLSNLSINMNTLESSYVYVNCNNLKPMNV